MVPGLREGTTLCLPVCVTEFLSPSLHPSKMGRQSRVTISGSLATEIVPYLHVQSSWGSSVNIATGLRVGRQEFDFRKGQRTDYFLSATASSSKTFPASYPMLTGEPFSSVKIPGCQVYHSPPSSAEVTNTWSYTCTPPYVLMARCLIKHRIRVNGDAKSQPETLSTDSTPSCTMNPPWSPPPLMVLWATPLSLCTLRATRG
jgi:hypothetical protein